MDINVPPQMLLEHDKETEKHIAEVQENIGEFIDELKYRAFIHDVSKFKEPERSIYALALPKLKDTVFGSKEYENLLCEVSEALKHHYKNNRHHPEFHKNGIEDMDLVDLMEMVADWKAATKRNKDGDIFKSIEINTKRYEISPQLAKILENTVKRYL